MNTYVYANFETDCLRDRVAAWRWILNESHSVEILQTDEYGGIEFKTTPEIVDCLWNLIDENCETIFEGTLEELYIAL